MIPIFTSSKLVKLITHFVGNKYNDDTFFYSKNLADITDSNINENLLNYFTSPFRNKEEYFSFWHESDLHLNTVNHYITEIFEDGNKFIDATINIAKHLYESTDVPNIKSGELYVCKLENVVLDDEVVDVLGIFKTENPELFFKASKSNESYQIELDKGHNLERIDKGCLIFNVNKERGFQLLIIDHTNKKEEARYWRDNFLKIIELNDNFHATQTYLDVCKHFVTDQLQQEYDVNKTDKIDFLNKTVDYFKSNKEFSEDNFLKNVFDDKNIIKSFKNFKDEYVKESETALNEDFEISNSAVKKQARVFKSVLKLDKNFHVYIHGSKDLIEKGFDSALGKSFYKIYFDEES